MPEEFSDFSDEFDEFDDEFFEEPFEADEEFAEPFGGSDFEDLPLAAQVAIIVIASLFFLVMLGIGIFILYLLYKLLDALPPQYRLMEPGMVWLLLIPCFNLIWNFFVYPRISRSYQHYFNAQGRTDVGDCGATLGIFYSVCAVLISIPCVNYVTGFICGPAMLILIIIYLVKLHELKKQIRPEKTGPAMPGQSPFSA
jgi:hypothetical protein